MDAHEQGWAATFAAAFSADRPTVEQRAFAAAAGDDHPDELDTYSWTTWTELREVAAAIALDRPGRTLVDVGCGRGGPGVWVARRTGARLVGIDVTDVPLAAAARRAAAAGVDARFDVGSVAATGLDAGSADAVVGIDVVMFADDRAAAWRELARVVRPGGRVVLTTTEVVPGPGRVPGRPDVALAADAGLRVLSRRPTPGWAATTRATTAYLLDHVDELAAETGADPADVRAALLAVEQQDGPRDRRVLLVAERPR